ncbi:MAG TPA: hypothetical protein VG714_05205 [Acidobacteriaceae bacterium]|nr:hypothetical protein [Acidobacteriaceae bacterium]
MSRCTLRYIFTVLIYAGVAMFLYPYLTGRLHTALIFVVAGICIAVFAGIMRCAFVEGDCPDREARASLESREPHRHSGPPQAPLRP